VNSRFDDRTVLVTGAAHGLGREIACAFARLGAIVCICDVIEDELNETAALCGRGTIARLVDVTDRATVREFVDACVGRTGGVHVLVNNAGGVLGQTGTPIEDVRVEDWRAIFAVNVDGAFHFAQAVVPHMKRAGAGRIINISSGAGLGVSLTGIQAYASAKAALIGLTRQLAHELGPAGITVNSIAPGFVRSNPATERQWQAYGEQGQRQLVDSIPLRRLGSPADIADAALFLGSDHAGWITGVVLQVSGGR
jgi:3-oxoacyl-[acyl-carrier protein] reductase